VVLKDSSNEDEEEEEEDQHLRGYLLEMSQYFKTKHLLMMVGADVNFEKAEYYYQSLTRIMTQFNSLYSDIEL
jgi:hypothetical protein